jgi:hypothetical protein
MQVLTRLAHRLRRRICRWRPVGSEISKTIYEVFDLDDDEIAVIEANT